MSIAAAQASKFYEQVVAEERVYTVMDGEGYLVFKVGDAEIVPFWSSRSRIEKIQKNHPKYAQWAIHEEPFSDFFGKTLVHMEEEGIRIGVNWSGKGLTGYDLSVSSLRRNLQYWIDKKNAG